MRQQPAPHQVAGGGSGFWTASLCPEPSRTGFLRVSLAYVRRSVTPDVEEKAERPTLRGLIGLF